MTSIGPYSKPKDYTHMYDFTDLRGPLPLKHVNQDSLWWHVNQYKRH